MTQLDRAMMPAGADDGKALPSNVINLSAVNPSQDSPTVILLNEVLLQAIGQRASDIHVEPHENQLLIRYRIDGQLVDWMELGMDHHAPLVSAIKVRANIDIAEHRLPQDGRINVANRGQRWDLRVSTIPGVFGEKAVLRLLPKEAQGLTLDDLGMQERDKRMFESMIAKPHGMILVTGPTGSGKTTTLYTALRLTDCVGKNVLTVEDPVEYELPRVTQMQVHPRIGLSFAAGLRSILRQDPDVIMVGEIRDAETLAMAVQSALTGHLVLSTLHCNDAASAPVRAIDMGLEPFLFTSSVIGIMAQRLVRRICAACRTVVPMTASERQRLGVQNPNAALYRGKGCQQCRNTGYRGRIGVYEIMMMNDALKQAVNAREPAHIIRKIAQQTGTQLLWDDALRKMQAGQTTLEEVLRAVYLDDESAA